MRSLNLFSLLLLILLLLHYLRMIHTFTTTKNTTSASPNLGSSPYQTTAKFNFEYDEDEYDYEDNDHEANHSDDSLETNESHRVANHPSSLLVMTGDEHDDFCSDTYVDSAYFNGYDTILTRGDRLWYYYKDRHRLSKAFDQRRFTQGDHIQGAFNISRTPYYCLNRRTRSHQFPSSNQSSTSGTSINKKGINYNPKRQMSLDSATRNIKAIEGGADCVELQKLRSTAVYFLHNKERTRSYYNLDVRHPNGTQRRVRSRDLPWNMKQVGLLGGNLWPNGWEMYQKFRPVAYLPSRYEMIFILNQHQYYHRFRNVSLLETVKATPSSILTWNNLDASNWNTSWRSKVLQFDPPVIFTGMFEMNGIVYAIGEREASENRRVKKASATSSKRIGKMFRYYVTENDDRDFKEMDQTVQDFFGCSKKSENSVTESSTSNTTSSIPTISVSPGIFKKQKTSTTIATNAIRTVTWPSTTPKLNSSSNEIFLKDTNEEESSNDIDNSSLSETTQNIGREKAEGEIIVPKKSSDQLSQLEQLGKEKSSKQDSSPSSVFLRNSRAKITSVQPNSGTKNSHHTYSYGSGSISYPKLASYPTVTLRETDSIMLTILIAIVIGASVLCIILACLVINGKKRHHPPHFEGAHRIEPTIPKPTIIGLDYHRRKNSTSSSLTPFNFLTRYDSMNSLTAIYSQVHHHPLSSHRSRLSPMTDPSPSPNFHALHPPPPVPPPLSSGGTILHNKSVSVNMRHLSKQQSGHAQQHHSSTVNMINNQNSNSVPNLVTEVTASNQNVATGSSTNNFRNAYQQQQQSHNRIKSFERFENLI